MPASTILGSIRQPLASALSSVSANIYDHVPEFPPNPFLAVVPADPYIEINLIGKSSVKVKLNFILTFGVQNADNAAALDNLEQLAISILAAIPSGYEMGSVGNIGSRNVGNGESLAGELPISCYYTQTN